MYSFRKISFLSFIQLFCLFLTINLMSGCAKVSLKSEDKEMQFRVADVFSDNMVLQRRMKVPVWGWAASGSEITVEFEDHSKTVKARSSGQWQAEIGPFEAGGPYDLLIHGPETFTFSNVLVGEVWLASGQSNMEWPVGWAKDAKKEVRDADYPLIRLYTMPHRATLEPVKQIASPGWQVCAPETIESFSAAAYFFGRNLHENLHIPIGLINCSWGGSSMEAWTRPGALKSAGDFDYALKQLNDWADNTSGERDRSEYLKRKSLWEKQTGGKQRHTDPGVIKLAERWADPDFDDSEWKTMPLPGMWEEKGDLPDVDGVVWFRKSLELPEEWAGRDLTLCLGAIDDTDITFFNGTKIGATGLDTENYWSFQRIYEIPGDLVKAGKNVIAVRVFDHYLSGGFGGPEKVMYIFPKDGKERIAVSGRWKYEVATALQQMPLDPFQFANNVPSLLYNGMIEPLIPFGIRGVIWYQGESNADRAEKYRDLSEIMITDWRKQWGQGEFPFIFVQLAGFQWDSWAKLRQAQLETLKVPGTAMVVAADIGEIDNIHPANKQEVGRRLALAARGMVYGEDIVYSGPIIKSMEVKGSIARLNFDHVGSGLIIKDGPHLKGFEMAGEDGEFLPAEAIIVKNTVVVRNPEIKNPKAVRYGWSAFPEGNLYNKEGLPASPFEFKK